MKSKLLIFFFSFLLFSGGYKAYATHIFGGELLYKNIQDVNHPDDHNLYVITLTLYGDCSAAAFQAMDTLFPQVVIYNGASVFDTVYLNLDIATSNIEVSPVCLQSLAQTTCQGGTLPGVKEFLYKDTIKLPMPSANWKFVYTGGDHSHLAPLAGRSTNITNVQNPGNSIMCLVASLNNTLGVNSSPDYSTVPTPFYCVNTQQQYNQGAIDPDNDSLAFSLSPGLTLLSTSATPVSYIYPYSADFPLSTNTFNFNPASGQMSFSPNAIQDALVVTTVTEYKNGRVVGSSMREMTFIVLDNCQNAPPYSTVISSSITGATIQSDYKLNICTHTPQVSFELSVGDPNADNITVSINNTPVNAIATVSSNSTNAPIVHFDWNTANVPSGVYNLFITLKDDHCPLTSTQTIAYTLNIVDTNTFSELQLFPTQCLHQAYVQFNLAGGVLPRTVVVIKDSSPFTIYNDYSGIVRDSFPPGNYQVFVSSYAYACNTQGNFSVVDEGALPVPTRSVLSYCQYDTVNTINIYKIPNAIVTWYNAEGIALSAPPSLNTSIADSSTYLVTQQYQSCISDKDTVDVLIHELPRISFVDIPNSPCLGDKVYLAAEGGIDYQWSPMDSILRDDDSRLYVKARPGQQFMVKVSNVFNCADSTTLSFSDVQPCCQFSYPNAFTPNGNGRNDKFGIPVYGNLESYDLSIYDRWGKRVFRSFGPADRWDGTYRGEPCDIGTYFYLLKARCVTGHEEQHFGDLTLIR